MRAFRFGDRELGYAINPGERAVEIPIARLWYARHDVATIVEVGAVTPYWLRDGMIHDTWTTQPVAAVPHRVIDPSDPYPLAEKTDVLDADLEGAAVLCISTLEHVGVGEYPGAVNRLRAGMALDRIIEQATGYFVTWPTGIHPELDAHGKALIESGGATGFQLEQNGPGAYRVRRSWDWRIPYGSPDDDLPYGCGVVFLTDDMELLAMAEATPCE